MSTHFLATVCISVCWCVWQPVFFHLSICLFLYIIFFSNRSLLSCLSVCTIVSRSTWLPSVYQFVSVSVSLFICLSTQRFVCHYRFQYLLSLFFFLSFRLSQSLTFCLSAFLHKVITVCQQVSLFASLSICQFTGRSMRPPIFLQLCQIGCLSVSLPFYSSVYGYKICVFIYSLYPSIYRLFRRAFCLFVCLSIKNFLALSFIQSLLSSVCILSPFVLRQSLSSADNKHGPIADTELHTCASL